MHPFFVKNTRIIMFLIILVLALTEGVRAQEISPSGVAQKPPTRLHTLNNESQALKKRVMDISRDLTLIEEEAKFPERSRISVFLGMDRLPRFDLDSVELSVNGKVVATHVYAPEETAALRRGGLHRLYIGNLNDGDQLLTALLKGKAPDNPHYHSSVSLSFKKGQKSQVIALSISDLLQDNRPGITARETQ